MHVLVFLYKYLIWKFDSLAETDADERKRQWLQVGLKVPSGQGRSPHPRGSCSDRNGGAVNLLRVQALPHPTEPVFWEVWLWVTKLIVV